MLKSAKFNPIITKIKLNPEQAVLTCGCLRNRRSSRTTNRTTSTTVCSNSTTVKATNMCTATTAANAAVS